MAAEKFTAFCDVKTGINPWTGANTLSVSSKTRFIDFVVLLPYLIICLLVALIDIIDHVIASFRPRGTLFSLESTLARLAARLLRITTRRVSAGSVALQAAALAPVPGRSTLYLCNHSCPEDFLAALVALPVDRLIITHPVCLTYPAGSIPEDAHKVAVISPLDALLAAAPVRLSKGFDAAPPRPLAAAAAELPAGGAAAVFFELTATNGRGVLPCPAMSVPAGSRLVAAGFAWQRDGERGCAVAAKEIIRPFGADKAPEYISEFFAGSSSGVTKIFMLDIDGREFNRYVAEVEKN